MKRNTFLRTLGAGLAAVQLGPVKLMAGSRVTTVRLGGPVFDSYEDPGEWIQLLKKSGYTAAYCPVNTGADPELVRAYRDAAAKHDIVISEVGAWSNPIDPDRDKAEKAVQMCIEGLELADRIGARCCVNISGSRNEQYWAGPHKDNFSPGVFDMVVEITREIIDAVKPRQSHFALEAMPWALPDSTDSYLSLLKAIDRPQFGVHLDPVNMIRSPREYFNNGALIRDMFSRLGSHVVSCHAKDIILREDNYIPQLDELRAGLGKLDYVVYLQEIAKLRDVPLMMEHLDSAEEYDLAANHIRFVAKSVGISI